MADTPLNDKQVIEEFLRQHHPSLSIDRMPDVENRNTEDIDAIAGTLAIEHTSVDVMPNQRGVVSKYHQIVRPLRERYRDHPARVYIEIAYDEVASAKNFDLISREIDVWLSEHVGQLEDGRTVFVTLDGSGFKFQVTKEQSDYKGFRFRILVDQEKEGLADQVAELLPNKARKLRPYKADGLRTILVVESNDFQLMNQDKLWEAVEAVELPGVDEIWFADTMLDNDVQFWKLGEDT